VSHNHSKPRGTLYVLLVLGLALSACSNQMEPAKKAIADIEAAVSAAGADAQRYIPDQVKAVTDQLAGLKAKFEQKDYDTFLQAYLNGKVKRMVVVASLDDPQISAGTWERARTTSTVRRERTATAASSGERSTPAAWARDRTAAAPFARVD